MKEQQKETSAKMVTLNKFAPKDSQTKTDGMYDPAFEHDNCGIGSVVNIKGIKTHETVENALKIVENLKHRAGKDAEGKTGDGVGILLQISHKFFTKAVKPLGIELGGERDYGIGMFFFPQDELKRNQAKKMFEVIVQKEGMEFLGWREVPIDPTKLETELGWKPKYNFDTGIQQTIQWYLDNEDWWKHILSGEYSNYFDNMYGDRLGKDLK